MSGAGALDLAAVAAIRDRARAAGLDGLGDLLVLRGVTVEDAREAIDAARFAELRCYFNVNTGGDTR